MRRIVLKSETDWDGWRHAARCLVLAGVEPGEVSWAIGNDVSVLPEAEGTFHVPRALVLLASVAIQARDAARFGLLYSLVWRINAGEKLLQDETDADLMLVRRMALAVRSDAHRMRTAMRFLPVPEGDGTRFVGWYQPAHFVLPANAQVFARRFADLTLSVVTPDGAAHWDGSSLRFGAGLADAADDPALRAWWDAHGAALLGQASAVVSVPEAEDLDEAPRRPDRPALGPVVWHTRPDAALLQSGVEASGCRRCPLYEPATQTIFGEGPADAPVMFVGEQPGDQEDSIGRPFVGPAGQMMDRAMEEAGIDRRAVYVTNAVKHFKFTLRGKRDPPDSRCGGDPGLPFLAGCGARACAAAAAGADGRFGGARRAAPSGDDRAGTGAADADGGWSDGFCDCPSVFSAAGAGRGGAGAGVRGVRAGPGSDPRADGEFRWFDRLLRCLHWAGVPVRSRL